MEDENERMRSRDSEDVAHQHDSLMKIQMADDFSSSAKDIFLAKASKNCTLIGKMTVLVFAMASKSSTQMGILDVIKVINETCPQLNIEAWEMPHALPKTQNLLQDSEFCLNLSDISFFLPPHLRDECACNPVRYYALLLMQRCGSGRIETSLNNHTDMGMFSLFKMVLN